MRTFVGSAGSALLAAGLHLEDRASPVQFKAATIQEELFQLAPGALNAGLCPGCGKSKPLPHLLLREALPLRQQQGVAVGGLQFVNELSHARAEVWQVGGNFGCNSFRKRLPRPQPAKVIGDGVARDAPDPCFDALASFERRKAALNLDEDVLQDVFGCGVVADSGADEGAKPARQRFPDAFHRRGHFRRSIRVRSTPRQA